jgi:excinuclease ABC subunit C
MQLASDELDFERAAVYRDRLAALSHVQSHQGINPQSVEEADVFALHQEGGQTCIQVFFFRTGQNWGNRAYFPKADPSLEPAEVLGSFLAQFYDDKPSPRTILLAQQVEEQELLAQALATRAGHKVSIGGAAARREEGPRRPCAAERARGAGAAAGRNVDAGAAAGGAEARRSAWKSRRRASRSTTTRTSWAPTPSARMIVAGAEGFVKNQYRKFNIRSTEITPGDDFGMMREVMERRFSRLLKEEQENGDDALAEENGNSAFPAWPDVILIDGGQGQMSAVRGILDKLGVAGRVTAIGVAKGVDRDAGRERFFVAGRDSFTLPVRDPVLYFVQRLRDEAHRFAIGSHRARRKKEMTKNPLDEIAGIGPGRKRALLMHFGTAKAVSRAAMDDLMAVDGISESVARAVYNHFHEN